MEEIIMYIVLPALVACALGAQDAHVYAAHPERKITMPDEHRAYVVTRLLIALAVYGFSMKGLLMVLAFGMIFSFFHNGMYYTVRNIISIRYTAKAEAIYPGWWFHNKPKNSTARIQLMAAERILMFFIGIVIYYAAIRFVGHG